MVTRYQLFTFTEENAKDSMSIDFAPPEWIEFDQVQGKLMCKFMPPPYNKKKLICLTNMRKKCDPPLCEWPSYPIEIRGSASMFFNCSNHNIDIFFTFRSDIIFLILNSQRFIQMPL